MASQIKLKQNRAINYYKKNTNFQITPFIYE